MKEVFKGAQLFKEECEGTVEVVWRKKDRTTHKHLEDEIARLEKEETAKNQNMTNVRRWSTSYPWITGYGKLNTALVTAEVVEVP